MSNDVTPTLNQFYVGNCLEIMADWPEGCIDLTVTSPPYDDLRDYKDYEFDAEAIIGRLLEVTADGGIVVWVVGDRINGGRSLTSFRHALAFQEAGFTVHDVMIYQKRNTPFGRSNAYTNAYELMIVAVKGKVKTFNPVTIETVRNGPEMLTYNKRPDGINKKRLSKLNPEKRLTNVWDEGAGDSYHEEVGNIWEYAVGLGGSTNDRVAFQHPAIFPERLALEHILSWSNPGDVVFDPMCGSGTTCKVAYLFERPFVGIDISPEYIGIAETRLSDYGWVKPYGVRPTMQPRLMQERVTTADGRHLSHS